MLLNSGPPPDLWGRTDHEGKFVFKWRKIKSEGGKVIRGPEITINGTAWLDVDVDAIRQPSDPVVPDQAIVFSPYGMRSPNDLPRSITIHVFIGIDPPTGGGCVVIPYPMTEDKLTVDIRATLYSDAHLAARDSLLKWPVADGHFFKEAAVSDVDLYDFPSHYQRCDGGFTVTNADGIPFWDTWKRLGLENVGYPISHRFMWRGFVNQAFQKVIMQWQPGKGVVFVDIFGELHPTGRDGWLRKRFATPYQMPASLDADMSREERQSVRLALLNANPAIKRRYFAASNPLLQYGLPTSRVEDMGNHYAIRTQKTVFQQWKEDVPWAKAGEVTLANGGDIAMRFRTCEWRIKRVYCTYLFFSEDVAVRRDRPPDALFPLPVSMLSHP